MQREPSGRRNKQRAWLGKVCLDVGAPWPFWVPRTWANCLGLCVAIVPSLKASLKPWTPRWAALFLLPSHPPGLRAHTTLVLAPLAFIVATQLLDTSVPERVSGRMALFASPLGF